MDRLIAAAAKHQGAPGADLPAIASHHPGHPERVADYFNQSLLEDPTRSNEDEPTPQP